jgi:hypothetical protein
MGDDGFENIGSPTTSRKIAAVQEEQEELELRELEAGIQAAKLLEEEDKEGSGDSSSSDSGSDDESNSTPWDALKWYPILDAEGNQVCIHFFFHFHFFFC